MPRTFTSTTGAPRPGTTCCRLGVLALAVVAWSSSCGTSTSHAAAAWELIGDDASGINATTRSGGFNVSSSSAGNNNASSSSAGNATEPVVRSDDELEPLLDVLRYPPNTTDELEFDADLISTLSRVKENMTDGERLLIVRATEAALTEVIDADGGIDLSSTAAGNLGAALGACCLGTSAGSAGSEGAVLGALGAADLLGNALLVATPRGGARELALEDLHVMVARAPHNITRMEMTYNGAVRANVTMPGELLMPRSRDWKVQWSVRGPAFPGVDVKNVTDGILGPFLRNELSVGLEPVPLVDLSAPLTFDMRLFRKYTPRLSSLPTCAAFSADGTYTDDSCVSMPMRIPRHTTVEWNPNYRIPNPFGSGGLEAEEPAWLLTFYSHRTGKVLDCKTATVNEFVESFVKNKVKATFGIVTFQGSECPWVLETREDFTAEMQYAQIDYATGTCFWDIETQTFTGMDCVEHHGDPSASYQSCMCTSAGPHRIFRIPINMERVREEEVTEVMQEDEGSRRSFLVILVMLTLTAVLCIASRYYTAKSKNRLALRSMTDDHGFQAIPDPWLAEEQWRPSLLARALSRKPSSQGKAPPLEAEASQLWEDRESGVRGRAGCCSCMTAPASFPEPSKIWIWELNTSAFPVLLDDMEEFEKMDKQKQKAFPFFSNSAASLAAFVGLPVNRILCAVPEARFLSWVPANASVLEKGVTRDLWVQQALGTSMMMAFLDSRELVGESTLQRQYRKHEKYFAGCHPLGFHELVLRWKVMLMDNLHRRGWYRRACIWKLLWLQRADGLWDMNEGLAVALLADSDVLQPAVVTNQPMGIQNLKDLLPEVLEGIFAGNTKLQQRVWCALLATAYLEDGGEIYHCFTGWEGEGMERGSSVSALARFGIIHAISTSSHKAWLKKNKKKIKSVISELEIVAYNVVRSYRNLQETRLHMAASKQLEVLKEHTSSRLSEELARQRSNQRRRSGARLQESHASGGIIKKDMKLIVKDMQKEDWQRRMDRAMGIKGDYVPGLMTRAVRFFPCLIYEGARKCIQFHDVLHILIPSPIDRFTQWERMIVATATFINLFSATMMIFVNKQEICCDLVRERLSSFCEFAELVPGDTREVCTFMDTVNTTSPFGVRVTTNQEYTAWSSGPEGFSCSWLLSQDEGDSCDEFPDYLSVWDYVRAGLVASLCALPLKILLRFLFSQQRRHYSQFWTKPKARFLRVAQAFLTNDEDAQDSLEQYRTHMSEEFSVLQANRVKFLDSMMPEMSALSDPGTSLEVAYTSYGPHLQAARHHAQTTDPGTLSNGTTAGVQTSSKSVPCRAPRRSSDYKASDGSRGAPPPLPRPPPLQRPPPPLHHHQDTRVKFLDSAMKPEPSEPSDPAALSDPGIALEVVGTSTHGPQIIHQAPRRKASRTDPGTPSSDYGTGVRSSSITDGPSDGPSSAPHHAAPSAPVQRSRRVSMADEKVLLGRRGRCSNRLSMDLGMAAMPMVAPVFSNRPRGQGRRSSTTDRRSSIDRGRRSSTDRAPIPLSSSIR